jgi:hypothetical protein
VEKPGVCFNYFGSAGSHSTVDIEMSILPGIEKDGDE